MDKLITEGTLVSNSFWFNVIIACIVLERIGPLLIRWLQETGKLKNKYQRSIDALKEDIMYHINQVGSTMTSTITMLKTLEQKENGVLTLNQVASAVTLTFSYVRRDLTYKFMNVNISYGSREGVGRTIEDIFDTTLSEVDKHFFNLPKNVQSSAVSFLEKKRIFRENGFKDRILEVLYSDMPDKEKTVALELVLEKMTTYWNLTAPTNKDI